MTSTTRKRTFISQTFTGTGRGTNATAYLTNKEETASSGHQISLLGSGDQGGFFYTAKTYSAVQAPHVVVPLGIYDGPLFATPGGTNGAMAMLPVPGLLGLYGAGATAIARSIPTNPHAGLATFIGEIRKDGIPYLFEKGFLRERTKVLKNSGGQYLNVEFGWKPIVRDLVKFARVARDSSKVLQQFERDSGRKIRRKYEFPASGSTVAGTSYQSPGTLFGQLRIGEFEGGLYTSTYTTSSKRWFSGAFRYALPTGNDTFSKARRFEAEANKLLGTRLTPEVVWNLAPWSWAADWFGNTGDVIHNASAMASDGLTMQYGYIMQHDVQEVTYTWNGSYLAAVNPHVYIPTSATSSFGAESKIRVGATPFGFGLNWDGFTPKQLAIAAAIGVTR